MHVQEFITILKERAAQQNDAFPIREGTPLGIDAGANVVFSQTEKSPLTMRHTCVTGTRKTEFIKRLILTLSYLYGKSEANFLILSPRLDYGELMRLSCADVTVPFVRSKTDLQAALQTVGELLSMYALGGKGYPKLFLVMDGLEEIDGCNENSDLEEYFTFFEKVARNKNVEFITGAELMKSIFSGYPGAFVGVGNCLITTREEGKADVTYVGDDSTLSLPTVMEYPASPSVMETIITRNALDKKTNAGANESGIEL